MSRSPAAPRSIAIIGAGPIGLEAALYALRLGFEVTVYEQGDVAAAVARWGFVELFSPWKLNVSTLGLEVLKTRGVPLPDPDEFPSGDALRLSYLLPIAEELGDRLRIRSRVLAVGRQDLLKGEAIGQSQRAARPFRILFEADGEERVAWADCVLDASGVYGQAAFLGAGGLPALGETHSAAAIERHLPDLLGCDRERFSGRTTLLVGSGYSAATALRGLLELAESDAETRVVWARRDRRERPLAELDDDPLPERAALARFANAQLADPPPGARFLAGTVVERLAVAEDGRLQAHLGTPDGPQTVRADRLLALVGYRPDLEVTRELQVHLCYATEGPMRLAAALLGQEGGGDCLSRTSPGPEALATTEPGFFIIGHKSYGRRSDFLLRSGREQIRDAFRLLMSNPTLDLYESSA